MDCEQTLLNIQSAVSSLSSRLSIMQSDINDLKESVGNQENTDLDEKMNVLKTNQETLLQGNVEIGEFLGEMSSTDANFRDNLVNAINTMDTQDADTNTAVKAILNYLNKVQQFLKI